MEAEKKKKGPVATVQRGSIIVKIYEIASRTSKEGKAYRFKALRPDGRPTTRSNLEDAKSAARKEAQLMAEGVTASTTVKASDLSELAAARRIAGDQGMPLLPALGEWEAAKKLTGPRLMEAAQTLAAANPATERVTLQEAWTRCLRSKDLAGTKATMSYGAKAKTIIAGLGGGLMLDTITTRTVTDWAEKIPDGVTRNDLVGRLGMMFRWAQGQGLFPEDRAIPTDRVPAAREKKPDIGILSASQFRAVLDLNWAIHCKNPVSPITAAEIGTVVANWKAFEAQLHCPTCSRMVKADGSLFRCGCGHTVIQRPAV